MFLLSGSSISLLSHSYNHDPAVAFVLIIALGLLPCRHCHVRTIAITVTSFIILPMSNTSPFAFESVFAAICGNMWSKMKASSIHLHSEIFNHDDLLRLFQFQCHIVCCTGGEYGKRFSDRREHYRCLVVPIPEFVLGTGKPRLRKEHHDNK